MAKMMNIGKRVLVLFLALIVCFSTLQVSAFANSIKSQGHIHLQMNSSSEANSYKAITVYFTEASGMPTAKLTKDGSEWVANGDAWKTNLGTRGYTLVSYIHLVLQDGTEVYRTAASAKCQDNTGVDLTLGTVSTPLIPVVVQVYYEQNFNQNDFQLVRTDTTAFAKQEAGTNIQLTEAQIAAYGQEGYSYVVVADTKTGGTVPTEGTLVLEVYFELSQDPNPPAVYPVTYEYTGNVPENAPTLPAAASYKAGDAVTVAAEPTLENYTFSGWDTEDFTMPAQAVVIRGSWSENAKYDYSLIYNANFGSNETKADEENISGTYATSHAIEVNENSFERANYTFIGWNTQADGNGTAYAEGDTVSLTAENNTAILYAQWQENPKYDYEVTYNANFGLFPATAADEENIYGTYATTLTIEVNENPFERANYTFIGWSEERRGEVVFAAGDQILFTEGGEKTLYAQWVEHNKYAYTVIYNGNGGVLADGEVSYGDSENLASTYATSHRIAVDSNVFVRENHTFIGWNTRADGQGKAYSAEDVIALTAEENTETLYAQWRINEYEFHVRYMVRIDDGAYTLFTGTLPEDAPTGGKALYGTVLDETTLAGIPAALSDSSYTYNYTALDGVRIPFGSNTVIVYYTYVSPEEPVVPPVEPVVPEEPVVPPVEPVVPEEPVVPPVEPVVPSVEPSVPVVEIPEEPVPLAPSAPVVEIPEESVPLAPAPAPSNSGLVDLPDEDVPLASVPKTGDPIIVYAALCTLSGMGLLGLNLKKKEEEEA